jgi:uncharacterized coiled-coil DUF342 family protein
MAFFTVYTILSLSRRQEDALVKSAEALQGLDASFKVLLTKLDTSGLTPEQEQQVADLITQLKASGDALRAAEAAQPQPGG